MTTSSYAGYARQTVMFVDADPDTLDMYSAIASAEGIWVELATSGREAIALATLVRPRRHGVRAHRSRGCGGAE